MGLILIQGILPYDVPGTWYRYHTDTNTRNTDTDKTDIDTNDTDTRQ